MYKSTFYKVRRNILSAKVFKNEILVNDGGTSTVRALGRAREQELDERLSTLCTRDFLGENFIFKSKNEIDLILGIRTTFVEYFWLRTEIARLKTSLELRGKLSRKLKTIFNSKRKGSRVLRMEIQNSETTEYYDTDLHEMPMIRRIEENVEMPTREILEMHMGLWGKLFLEPELKNFLFRLSQGRLHTNQIRANFQENQERGCTFCTIHSRMERIVGVNIEEETLTHLFWDCIHVNGVMNWVGNELIGRRLTMNEGFYGIKCRNKTGSEVLLICLHWTKFWVYNRKQCNRMVILREYKTDWEQFKLKLLSKQRFRDIVLPVAMLE